MYVPAHPVVSADPVIPVHGHSGTCALLSELAEIGKMNVLDVFA